MREPFSALKTRDPDLQRTIERVTEVAKLDLPLLIQGEPGTGKLLFARAVHEASPRREGPFVEVICGALAPDQASTVLFGHSAGRGGRRALRGEIDRANGGTLFLDEVSELPLEAQIRLRKLLLAGEIQPVGSSTSKRVDVRIVAASHKNLLDDVRRGQFRLDLYYELAVAIARIPPLRQRQLDLDLLIDHFLDQLAQDGVPPKLSTPARKYLLAQPWHGNVRELENALRRASLWARGAKIQLADVRDELDDPRGPYSSDVMQRPLSESFRIDEILGEVESHYIKLALQQTGGNKARAAALLGLNNSTTLTNRMQKHGVI